MSWKYEHRYEPRPEVVPVTIMIEFPANRDEEVKAAMVLLEKALGTQLFFRVEARATFELHGNGGITDQRVVYLCYDVPRAEYNALVSPEERENAAVLAEREACAKIAENFSFSGWRDEIAALIRRRSP